MHASILATDAAPARPRASGLGLWLVFFLIASLLYVATADRGPQWQDAGWQQFRIVTGQIDHPLGLALTHPLQFYLGRAAVRALPTVEPAFAITLVSCLAAAIAVANLAVTLRLLTGSMTATLLPTAAFALSHTFWQHATHTESYALVAALLTGEWLCLAIYATTGGGRALLLLAVLNGLGVANHLLALLATPVDLAVALHTVKSRRLSIRSAVLAALFWVVGTLPYAALVVSKIAETGDIAATLRSALFGTYAADVLNTHLSIKSLAMTLGFAAYNFPGLVLPLAIYGLCSRLALPKVLTRTLRIELLIYVVFVARYSIKDQYSFYFPVYALVVLFAGLGLARAIANLQAGRRTALIAACAITALWTPLVYAGTAKVLASRGALASLVGNKPYRDGHQAFFVPWGVGQDYARRLNEEAFRLAGTDGLILFEDNMMGFGLRYEQAVGRAPETVTIMRIETEAPEDAVAKRRGLLGMYLAQQRPVVLVPRDRDKPAACISEAEWERCGDLYLLKALDVPPWRYPIHDAPVDEDLPLFQQESLEQKQDPPTRRKVSQTQPNIPVDKQTPDGER